jgi:hypothetical protein
LVQLVCFAQLGRVLSFFYHENELLSKNMACRGMERTFSRKTYSWYEYVGHFKQLKCRQHYAFI